MKKRTGPAAPLTKGVAKVPVVIQLEALECGAACLTMVLAYYGKWVPLEQVRADCGVSRDGSNARNILKAARSHGLVAKGYRYEPESLKSKGAFPCIVHWNFNHFVVLCGFKKDKAVINDPGRGRLVISMDAFDKAFTGICLMLEPGETFVPGGRPRSVVAFARKKLTGAGAAFALVVVTTVITSLIGIITPGFSNVFADRLLTGKNPEWFTPFMLGISVLAALQIIIAWIQAVYSLKTNGKLAIAGNSQYMWHVLRLPMEFFSQRMAGDISARRTENAGIAEQLVSTFAPLVIQAGMMVFYLVVMLRYSWLLSLLGIASVVLNTAVSRYISRKRIDLTRVSMRDQGKLVSTMVAGIEMIESIKASGAENGYFRKWAGYQASVNASKVQFARIDAYLGSIPTVVSTLTNAGVLMGSIYLCMRGEWSVGMVSAFSSYLTMFMTPATQMINAGQTLQELRASMERIEDVLDYPTDVEYASELDEHVEYGKLGGRIEMRNVTFGYSRLAEPLIRDFNMTLEPGRKVAFVGGSGCKEHAGQADFGPVQALERRNPLRWQAHIRHQPQRVHRFGGGGRSGSDPV